MEPIAALMLLVGCNADLSSCTEVPVPTPIYASASDCDRALPLEMRMAGTGDAQLLGRCTPVDRSSLDRGAGIEWAVNRSGALAVALTDETAVVASR